jgi:hypothetical protein
VFIRAARPTCTRTGSAHMKSELRNRSNLTPAQERAWLDEFRDATRSIGTIRSRGSDGELLVFKSDSASAALIEDGWSEDPGGARRVGGLFGWSPVGETRTEILRARNRARRVAARKADPLWSDESDEVKPRALRAHFWSWGERCTCTRCASLDL